MAEENQKSKEDTGKQEDSLWYKNARRLSYIIKTEKMLEVKKMKKLWIVIVFLLLLCGCSTKSQNAVIAGTPVETEREQAESAALSEVQETQENSEREESANHQTEADAQDDANEYLHGEETSAEETDAQEETAVSPSDKAKQEADAGNREKAEPLPAKPKLGDFLYASVPDDAFICELDKMWVDDTPIQWRIYTQPEEMEYCATGNAENAFAPVELTENIYIIFLIHWRRAVFPIGTVH